MTDEAYTVVGNGGCPHCRAGMIYDVAGPRGVALGMSYTYKEDAGWMAKQLTVAYHAGERSVWALVFVGKEGTPEELTEMRYLLCPPLAEDRLPLIERTIRVADSPQDTHFDFISLQEFADEVKELVSSGSWKIRFGS